MWRIQKEKEKKITNANCIQRAVEQSLEMRFAICVPSDQQKKVNGQQIKGLFGTYFARPPVADQYE